MLHRWPPSATHSLIHSFSCLASILPSPVTSDPLGPLKHCAPTISHLRGVASSSSMLTGIADQLAAGKVVLVPAVTDRHSSGVAAEQMGLPLMGTVIEVELVWPPLVS